MSLRLVLGAALVASLAADPSSARADVAPTSETAPRATKPKTRWYGGLTLAVDGAVGVLWLAALATKSDVLAWGGVHAYALGPPLVHFARGNTWLGLTDIGLRVGAPLACALTGAAALGILGGGDGDGAAAGAALGLIGGYVLAVIGDAALLAREPIDGASSVGASGRSRALPPTARIAPWIRPVPSRQGSDAAATPAGVTLGIQGYL